MEVKEDFYMYRSGIYRYSSPPEPVTSSAQRTGYHSVRIIGYSILHNHVVRRLVYLAAAETRLCADVDEMQYICLALIEDYRVVY